MSSAAPAAADPEAAAPSARACRPWRWVLGAAALLLLGVLLVAAVAWLLSRPATGPEPLRDQPRQWPGTGTGTYAQLLTQNVLLKNGTLSWHSDPGLKDVFLSRGLRYDEGQQELVVDKAGDYWVFLQLALSRKVTLQGTFWGKVSLFLHLQGAGAAVLDATVDLSPCSAQAGNSARDLQARLMYLDAGQRLSARLYAEADAHKAWQLAQNATVLGLVRLSGEAEEEFSRLLA